METVMAFATVVTLLCDFIQLRKDQTCLTKQDFLDWLGEQHRQVKDSIAQNAALLVAIDSYLKQGYDSITQQLSGIDNLLASLLSKISGLDNIVQAVKPNCELSEQAISILRKTVNSLSESFFKIVTTEGTSLMLLRGGNIQITEEQFVNDDLNTLVELYLLNLRYNRSGDEVYDITRNAKKLIDLIDSKK